jgi:Replication protein
MSATPDTIKKLILHRRQLKVVRENQQRKLLSDEDLFHDEIRDKLDGRFLVFNKQAQEFEEAPQFRNFCRCGHEKIYRTCLDCGQVSEFDYRCNIKWCPRCQWRIAATRQARIQAWTCHVQQPKHLVTTQRNFPVLTRRRIREHQHNLVRLRRTALFENVLGGCVSIEITNEGNGWHLHAHWLVDARWVDAPQLARTWGEIVDQESAIVKVLDVRGRNYTHEVCKYLAKGSEIASWPAEQIAEFVMAIRGRRFFFSFGSLFKAGAEIRAELAKKETDQPACDCGSSHFRFETDEQALLRELRKQR